MRHVTKNNSAFYGTLERFAWRFFRPSRSCAARQLCRRRRCRSAKCQTAPNSSPVRRVSRHVKFRWQSWSGYRLKGCKTPRLWNKMLGTNVWESSYPTHKVFWNFRMWGDGRGGANWMPLLSTIFYGTMTREHQKGYSGSDHSVCLWGRERELVSHTDKFCYISHKLP